MAKLLTTIAILVSLTGEVAMPPNSPKINNGPTTEIQA